ncbi:aromatic-L-amino-acid decarboxylase [Lepeophtheirus salmonis]|uniref:aromatic-L-amino-acid decarboxylase n=1 Tax=Lepeophtheirus salmonis TaxID=72036 RepID=UPI001AE4061F|nr:aromatic-L-amino-acid decarboxylase-like [Lepeophtheirus salmonis]
MTDVEEFRKFAKEMIDYVSDYIENVRDRDVVPSVEPGYIRDLLPTEAPKTPEHWKDVMNDIERVIMPGVTHWHHPNFHAYFPCANSYPGIVGDILSNAINCIGFSWIASPACTELEMVMMDWLGKMLDLPSYFLHESQSGGGGVIQGSASESTVLAILAARTVVLDKYRTSRPDMVQSEITSQLVAYASKQSHSSVERAGLLAGIKIRLLDYDKNISVRGYILENAIKEDREKGLIPFCFIATLGTTSCCSYDSIMELGPICNREGIYMHIDAAYAGSAFVCKEFRPILNGVEYADSFNFNPHKWMLVNFDCSAMWVKDSKSLTNSFVVDPLYLKHEYQDLIPDYRHWQIPLGRRFRSLKLWFVIRLYGVEGIQNHIRHHIFLAREFEKMVRADERFEIPLKQHMGLVCFRVKGPNHWNSLLNKKVNDTHKIHITPSTVDGVYILRFVVCSRMATLEDIQFAWKEIQRFADEVIDELSTSV